MAAGLLTTLGVGAIVLLGQSTSLFGRAPPPASQVTAPSQDVLVVDGGTIRVRDVVLRLHGISVPQRGDSCVPGVDCGAAAAAQLARLLHDKPVSCELDARDADRTLRGRCSAGDQELGAGMVASGWARAESSELKVLETYAKQAGMGVWAAK